MARRPELDVFREVNESDGPRMSWEDRKRLVADQYPSVEKLDWYEVLGGDGPEFSDVYVAIWRDILKADAAEPGRPGPRPALDWGKGVERFKQLNGQDFTSLPFAEAFNRLVGNRSLTSVARKTGLSKTVVFRFLRGERQPTRAQMESVARGFKKHPSFFVEYRNAMLMELFERRLAAEPEHSIQFYRQAFFGVGGRR